MFIWLIVIGLVVVLGVIGYYRGAIQASIALLGVVLAMSLSLSLAVPLRPLMPKIGVVHPIWQLVVPPLIVFALFELVFSIVGYLVHRKAYLHIKYKSDDYTRIKWEHLMRGLGVGIGVVTGALYSIVVGLIIYIFGYPAVQVVSEGSPGLVTFLAKARQDLQGSGLDRTLAAVDPMPEYYYLATDVIGLVYQNNVLQERISNYPAFLSLGQRSEFTDIANDTDLQNLLTTHGSFWTIINNPKILGLVGNTEILSELKQVDLKDLYNYLKTGKSAKYDEERILGRWRMDAGATMILIKKRNPDMPAPEMAKLKKLMTFFLGSVTLMATPDNKAVIKAELSEDAKKMIEAAKKAAEDARKAAEEGGGAPPAMDPRVAARYGLRRGGGGGGQAVAPAPAAVKPPDLGIPNLNLSSQGTWQRDGDKYKLSVQPEGGAEQKVDVVADEDRLLVSYMNQNLVFVR